jgi:hypothetical protein
MLEKELNAAKGDGAGTTGVVLDVFDIQEVLTKCFLGHEIWGFMEMFGQLTDGSDIHFLGTCRETSELKVLDHAFLKFCQSITPY